MRKFATITAVALAVLLVGAGAASAAQSECAPTARGLVNVQCTSTDVGTDVDATVNADLGDFLDALVD